MKEKGSVVEIVNSTAKVSLNANEACKTCSASHFCRPSGNARVIEAENIIGARIGDQVYIKISAHAGFIASFVLFGIPIILGLIGLVFGSQFSDTHSILYGTVGLCLGLLIAKIANNILRKKQSFLPKIIEIIESKKISERSKNL
jgi:sigma-E factor negative regulatory protein RseC